MRLATVIGTVTATSKDAQLVGSKLLLTNVVDSNGNVIQPSIVAVDTVGAGVGDHVLLVEGSSARIPASTASMPVDACVIAVIDTVSVAQSN
ncbi:EutN/CcmL family microcompartment protein [Granulosicoccus sp.]|nr:EutN/CcmL family microcompartment protein [Granulosicoccus sp.]MDB4223226.1 EutN/CcmL family microcompartment protein [Granulosicoccus sp.]